MCEVILFEKDSPEYEIVSAALSVAAAPPVNRGDQVFAAKVPWSRIDRLRKALDDAHIDWRLVRAIES